MPSRTSWAFIDREQRSANYGLAAQSAAPAEPYGTRQENSGAATTTKARSITFVVGRRNGYRWCGTCRSSCRNANAPTSVKHRRPSLWHERYFLGAMSARQAWHRCGRKPGQGGWRWWSCINHDASEILFQELNLGCRGLHADDLALQQGLERGDSLVSARRIGVEQVRGIASAHLHQIHSKIWRACAYGIHPPADGCPLRCATFVPSSFFTSSLLP